MTFAFIANLDTKGSIFLIICLIFVLFYEAINGFHDTANAVATVIYTKTLKPTFAVIWSGIWNFIGVWVGGIAVAMGMIKMLPLNDLMSQPLGENIALVMAILITAIVWNLGTWYLGIPNSSSHTMIGALLGGGFAFWQIHGGSGINVEKAADVGRALLFSPFLGFTLAIILMMILKATVKKKTGIFKEPDPKNPPPFWVRAILVTTCTLVSFFHGSNDGQKGVGLMLVVLIGFLPMQFAIDSNIPITEIKASVEKIDLAIHSIGADSLMTAKQNALLASVIKTRETIAKFEAGGDKKTALGFRKSIQTLVKDIDTAAKNGDITGEAAKMATAEIKPLKKSYEFAPTWAIALIALALGIGTMIGWKRIVKTIGEKIGKSHLTYAQGASAELIAAIVISINTVLALPVSTTHILSSGVAGTMVASGGTKNLNQKTLKNIALAWILTLPVTFVSAAALYMLFRLLV
jgi:inorganic phosphate transporter, PiT family